MRITVFGASGKVGRLVVEKLAAQGHIVTAVTHSHPPATTNAKIHYVQADIYDAQQVKTAIKNTELVMSCLGSWGRAKKDVLSAGMQNIIPAMQAAGIQRIITLTGAEALAAGEQYGSLKGLGRTLFKAVAGGILQDGEAHIQLLAKSGLDFTVLRSPAMTNSGSTSYSLTTKRPLPWQTIRRQAVANALAELTENNAYPRQLPFIVRQ